jgi:hypothetical protein
MIGAMDLRLLMVVERGLVESNPFIFGNYRVDQDMAKAWMPKVINDKIFDMDEF